MTVHVIVSLSCLFLIASTLFNFSSFPFTVTIDASFLCAVVLLLDVFIQSVDESGALHTFFYEVKTPILARSLGFCAGSFIQLEDSSGYMHYLAPSLINGLQRSAVFDPAASWSQQEKQIVRDQMINAWEYTAKDTLPEIISVSAAI